MDFPFHFGCSLGPPAPARDATSPCCPSCSPGVAPRPGTAPLIFPHSSCYAGAPRPLGCESPSGAAAGWCGGGMWSGGGLSPRAQDGQDEQGEDIELKDLSWRTKEGGGEGAGPVAETNIQEVCEAVSSKDPIVEHTADDVAMTTTTEESVQETYEQYYYDLGDADDLDDDDSDGIDAGPTDPIFFNPDGSIEVAFSDSETDQLQDFISLLPACPPSPPLATMSPTTGDDDIAEKHGRSVSFSPIRSVRPLLVGGEDSSSRPSEGSTNSNGGFCTKSGQPSKGLLTARSISRGRIRSRSVPNRALGSVALPFESEPYVQRLREEGKLREAASYPTQNAPQKTQRITSSTSLYQSGRLPFSPHDSRLPFSPHDNRSSLKPVDNRSTTSVHDSCSKCGAKDSRLSLSLNNKGSLVTSTPKGSKNSLKFTSSHETSSSCNNTQENRTTQIPERPKSILLPRIDGTLRGSSDSRVRFTDSTLQAAIEKSSSPRGPVDNDRRHLQIRVRMLSNSSEGLGASSGESPGWVSCRHPPSEDQSLASEWKKATGKPRPQLKGCRRSLSMEDAIINLANTQEKEPFRLHRTNSTDRITKHLRAKLGLPLPASSASSEPDTTSSTTSPISIPKNSLRRQCLRTVTSRLPLLPSQHRRVTSYSAVHTVSRSVGEETSSLVPLQACCRCHLNCSSDEGDFTCSGCSALQRVRNAFLFEVYSERSPTGPPSSSCYGVRVGLGLVPLVVALLSLLVCSFVLLSETVLGSACDIFCNDDRRMSEHRTRSDGIFDWLDPNK